MLQKTGVGIERMDCMEGNQDPSRDPYIITSIYIYIIINLYIQGGGGDK